MTTRARTLLLACTAGLLAACSGMVVTSPAYINPNYDPSILAYAAKEGPVYTEIIGAPFPGEEDRVANIVTETLREAQLTGRRLEFTTDPALASQRSPFRTIVLFNPAPGAASGKICSNSDQPRVEGKDDRVSVMVAYCNGGDAVSSVTGWTRADGPDSPQFAKLFKQVSLEIFPSRAIYSRSDGGNFERN